MQGSFRLYFLEFPLEVLIADAACGFLLRLEIPEGHRSCMESSIMTNLDRTTCPAIKERNGSSKSILLNEIRGVIFQESTCMTICKRRMHVSELVSHPLFAHISIMAWRIRMLWSKTDFRSVL